jgi:cell division protein FtsI/penicillin-binding protein 2
MNKTTRAIALCAAVAAMMAGCATNSAMTTYGDDLERQYRAEVIEQIVGIALSEAAKSNSVEWCWAVLQDVETGDQLFAGGMVCGIHMGLFGAPWGSAVLSRDDMRKRLSEPARENDAEINVTGFQTSLGEYIYPIDYWDSYAGSFRVIASGFFPVNHPRFYAVVCIVSPIVEGGENAAKAVVRKALGRIASACAMQPNAKMPIAKVSRVVRDALAEGRESCGADRGWAVIQNARTGEILCGEMVKDKAVKNAPKEPWREESIELGGLVLPFLAGRAIYEGVATTTTAFDVSSEKIGGVEIGDSVFGRTELSLSEIVKYSSNRGGASLAMALGTNKATSGLMNLGFSADGSPFEKENPDVWLAWLGMGRGVSGTGLEIASAFSAIANGGRLIPAWREGDWGGFAFYEYETGAATTNVCKAVCEMLREAVGTDGTGRSAAVEGLYTAGKTATVQLKEVPPFYKGEVYSRRFRSMFAGFFPVDDDIYTVLVVFELPEGTKTKNVDAGLVAAPVFAKIARGIAAIGK